MTVVLLLIGLGLIVFGADFLVDGASSIARKAGISEFVIGLTIVGFGTSCPELVVSLDGAIHGLSDISIGNVIGSNIFNVLLILGLTAFLMPVGISETNRRMDIPVVLGVTVVFILFGLTGKTVSRLEGIVLLLIFIAYIYYSFKSGKTDSDAVETASDSKSAAVSALLVILGLAALVFGGDIFVKSATDIAKSLGVSDKFIALTLLAGGTSLPELATCIIAAIKKKSQLALGNILGSNVFNILLIIGLSSVVTPLSFVSISLTDLATLSLSVILVVLSCFTFKRNSIDRFDGAVMLFCEAAYFICLLKGI